MLILPFHSFSSKWKYIEDLSFESSLVYIHPLKNSFLNDFNSLKDLYFLSLKEEISLLKIHRHNNSEKISILIVDDLYFLYLYFWKEYQYLLEFLSSSFSRHYFNLIIFLKPTKLPPPLETAFYEAIEEIRYLPIQNKNPLIFRPYIDKKDNKDNRDKKINLNFLSPKNLVYVFNSLSPLNKNLSFLFIPFLDHPQNNSHRIFSYNNRFSLLLFLKEVELSSHFSPQKKISLFLFASNEIKSFSNHFIHLALHYLWSHELLFSMQFYLSKNLKTFIENECPLTIYKRTLRLFLKIFANKIREKIVQFF